MIETGRGTTLGFAAAGSVVAVEVDNLHEHGHSGWTVMVIGIAEEVDDDPGIDRLRHLLADDRGQGDERFIRIFPELISGRRAPGSPTFPVSSGRDRLASTGRAA